MDPETAVAPPTAPSTNDTGVAAETTDGAGATNGTVRAGRPTVEDLSIPPAPRAAPVEAGHRERVIIDPGIVESTVELFHSGSGEDFAVVLFVVVGVFVVAVWVVYAGVYVADVLIGREHEYWWDLETHSSWLVGGAEEGALFGAKLATGIVEQDVQVGIAGEFGYLDMDVDVEDSDRTVELKGMYGLAGPAIRWIMDTGPNPSYFSLELLAGTSEHQETRLISTAKAGLNLGIGDRFRLGLTLGSLYVDLEANEGLPLEQSDFNVLLGAETGFRF
jgi:hypothetical protein